MKNPNSGSGFTIAGPAVLAALLACGDGTPPATDPQRDPVQVVQDFTMVQSVEGRRSWKLVSDEAVYTEGDSLLVLSGVNLTFYENDVPTTVLIGDSGRVDLEGGCMRIWNGVEAETDDGRRMVTQELTWNDSLGVLHSDCLVTMTIPDSVGVTILSGRGVDLDTNLGDVEGVDVREDFTAEYSGEIEID